MDCLRQAPAAAQVNHAIAAAHGRIDYNERVEWHDPDGHFYFLADERDPFDPPAPDEPLFFRARAGDVLNLTFTNAIGFRTPRGPVHVHAESQEHIPSPTEGQLEWMHYDLNIPPCDCLLVEGDRRIELGLAPDLEAVIVLLRLLQICLDHLPPLIDLHGEDGAMLATVLELLHRRPKRLVHLPDLRGEDLREAQENGELYSTCQKIIDDLLDVHLSRIALGGMDG